MALEAGTKLGPYEILSPLGAGGMGKVCLVMSQTINCYHSWRVRKLTLQVLRCSWSFFTVVVVLGLVASVTSAQDMAKSAKQPLGEEAYDLLTSYYDYDRHIPLEARVVEKQDLPNCTREKISVAGGRGEGSLPTA